MEELKSLQFQYELDKVKILGFKNQTELPAYFHIADIFVMPSMAEPWGLVLNEAMSCGCAVVVSDEVMASYDLVRIRTNGFVFPAGNIAELTNILMKMLSDPDLVSDMGLNSLKIISKWSFKENVQAIKAAISYLEARNEI